MKNSSAYIAPGLMTIDDIVCNVWGISITQLKGPGRKREGADARKFIMWYKKRNSDKSFAKIGELYGGRDHATVLIAAKKAEELMESDKAFRKKCEEALERIEKSKIIT